MKNILEDYLSPTEDKKKFLKFYDSYFYGLYNTIFEPDDEEEMTEEEYKDYIESIVDSATRELNKLISHKGYKVIKGELFSPKYYNYKNDNISYTIEVPRNYKEQNTEKLNNGERMYAEETEHIFEQEGIQISKEDYNNEIYYGIF